MQFGIKILVSIKMNSNSLNLYAIILVMKIVAKISTFLVVIMSVVIFEVFTVTTKLTE